VKFGLHFANLTFPEPAAAHRVARAAEAAGLESLITVEHVVWPTRYASRYRARGSGRHAAPTDHRGAGGAAAQPAGAGQAGGDPRVLVPSAAFLPNPETRLAAFGERVIRHTDA
jgi:hypothetical protein